MDQFLTYRALAALDCAYWERADGRSSGRAEALFVEDGELTVGAAKRQGRRSIGAFFDERAAQQLATQRFTRHFSSNLRIDLVAPNRACMHSMVLLFAGAGPFPGVAVAPSTIADVEDLCGLDQDGVWKFVRRLITPTFVGDGAASFVRN
jgi:hypothetical protein